eukprot:TRINITY_DN4196_c0_g1_i1.p1 TRINITY_DN4196_c0_g1~~TRINITY_DN4196_c0_g1_i1.p1  ORF type:complete len:560 (-),score=81.80 TRINITY_DN4196_c0_g1_i1:331-2010(-)
MCIRDSLGDYEAKQAKESLIATWFRGYSKGEGRIQLDSRNKDNAEKFKRTLFLRVCLLNSPPFEEFEDELMSLEEIFAPYKSKANEIKIRLENPRTKGVAQFHGKAFITFDDVGMAISAKQKLNGSVQNVLNEFYLETNLQYVITVPALKYNTLFEYLESMKAKIESSYRGNIKIDLPTSNPSRILDYKVFIKSDTVTALNLTKHRFFEIIQGRRVFFKDKGYQSLFFRNSVNSLLAKLQNDYKVVINRIKEKQILVICGPPSVYKIIYDRLYDYARSCGVASRVMNLKGKNITALIADSMANFKELTKKFQKSVQMEFRISQAKITLSGLEDDINKAELEIMSYIPVSTGSPQAINFNTYCSICGSEFQKKNTYRLELCSHKFCYQCLDLSVSDALRDSDRFPIVCPYEDCSKLIAARDIKNILGKETLRKLLLASLESHVNAHEKDYYKCPTPGCPQVLRADAVKDGVLECDSCYQEYCTKCNSFNHVGYSCDDVARDSLFWIKTSSLSFEELEEATYYNESEGKRLLEMERTSTRVVYEPRKYGPNRFVYGNSNLR